MHASKRQQQTARDESLGAIVVCRNLFRER